MNCRKYELKSEKNNTGSGGKIPPSIWNDNKDKICFFTGEWNQMSVDGGKSEIFL